MKARALDVGLFSAVSVGLSFYIGGYGLALVFLVAIALWLSFSTFNFLPNSSRFLGALVVSIFLPVITAIVFLPLVAKVSWLKSWAFIPPDGTPTDYISFSPATLGTARPVTLTLIIAALFVVIVGIVALFERPDPYAIDVPISPGARRRSQRMLEGTNPAVSRYVALIPLVGFSLLEQMDKIKAIAFMMSGDSRNIFLVVMRMRTTSNYPTPMNILQNGQFGETLSATLSSLNGVVGFPRKEDIYAMRSTYVLVFLLISCSIAVLFTSRSMGNSRISGFLRGLSALTVTTIVILSPYPFGEILRSGFFSFNVGLGFLAASIAFLVSTSPIARDSLIIAVVTVIATYLSYQMISLVLLPVLATVFYLHLWQTYRSKRAHIFQLLSVLGLEIITYYAFTHFHEKFVARVRSGGEIWPTDHRFVTVCLVVSLPLLLITRAANRSFMFRAAMITVSTYALFRFIQFVRGDDSDFYYQVKFEYAANFTMLLLTVMVIALWVSYILSWGKDLQFTRLKRELVNCSRMVLVAGAILIFGWTSFSLPQASTPISLITRGWDVPSLGVVNKTFDMWESDSPSYIFFAYFGGENDRLMNFWSPFLWEYNRWGWTYFGDSNSLASICAVSGSLEIQVFTKSEGLGILPPEQCSNPKMKIKSSKSNDFNFSS